MASKNNISKSKKYQDLIKTAHDLFWKHGFKRVTIEEICREANVSKMTFYRFFSNKVAIAKAVYSQVIEEGMVTFKNIMTSDMSSADKIKKILLLKLEGTNNISPEFIRDFYDHSNRELANYVDDVSRKAWEDAREEFRLAQENGVFRKNLNMDFFYSFIMKIDYTDKSLLKFFDTPQAMIMEVINLLMYGITPRQ